MKKILLTNTSSVNFSSRQRGASLLEGIAYLGIAALVILGAVSLLTGAFTSAQSNRGAEEVVSIRTAVKKLYMGQANSYGTADITAALITAKVFPTTLSPNAGGATPSLTNSWGGSVTVAGTGTGNTFAITYTGVPQD
ncbi:MAG: type 4 pilus major pilin, partial [Burkholderiaceae bacterium]